MAQDLIRQRVEDWAKVFRTDLWLRWTACFRRIDGVWLIVHDHVSVPADLEHGPGCSKPHTLSS